MSDLFLLCVTLGLVIGGVLWAWADLAHDLWTIDRIRELEQELRDLKGGAS